MPPTTPDNSPPDPTDEPTLRARNLQEAAMRLPVYKLSEIEEHASNQPFPLGHSRYSSERTLSMPSSMVHQLLARLRASEARAERFLRRSVARGHALDNAEAEAAALRAEVATLRAELQAYTGQPANIVNTLRNDALPTRCPQCAKADLWDNYCQTCGYWGNAPDKLTTDDLRGHNHD
jgi:hypothetical protein